MDDKTRCLDGKESKGCMFQDISFFTPLILSTVHLKSFRLQVHQTSRLKEMLYSYTPFEDYVVYFTVFIILFCFIV